MGKEEDEEEALLRYPDGSKIPEIDISQEEEAELLAGGNCDEDQVEFHVRDSDRFSDDGEDVGPRAKKSRPLIGAAGGCGDLNDARNVSPGLSAASKSADSLPRRSVKDRLSWIVQGQSFSQNNFSATERPTSSVQNRLNWQRSQGEVITSPRSSASSNAAMQPTLTQQVCEPPVPRQRLGEGQLGEDIGMPVDPDRHLPATGEEEDDDVQVLEVPSTQEPKPLPDLQKRVTSEDVRVKEEAYLYNEVDEDEVRP